MTAGPVEKLPFSARHYEDRLAMLDTVSGRQKGKHPGQVETLVRDLIGEVVRAQQTAAREHDRAEAIAERLKYEADDDAAARNMLINKRPPTMAVSAVMEAQRLAERVDDAASLEAVHLAETGAPAGPPVLVLPPEPSDLRAKPAWLRECTTSIDRYLVALADYASEIDRRRAEVDDQQAQAAEREAALVDRQGAVLAEVNAIQADMESIDLTNRSAGEATQAIEQVAS